MAVQVTLEFTDAQWALVQDHYPHTSLGRDEVVPITSDSCRKTYSETSQRGIGGTGSRWI